MFFNIQWRILTIACKNKSFSHRHSVEGQQDSNRSERWIRRNFVKSLILGDIL